MTTVFKTVPMPVDTRDGIISTPLQALKEVGDMTFIPMGGNPKTRRASIYGTAERLNIAVTVSTKPVGNVPAPKEPSFAVWRVQ